MYDTAESSAPANAPAGSAWGLLSDELDRWSAAGRTATLWWRDDDASGVTAALERLLALRRRVGVPLALAVVPATVDAQLTPRLAGEQDVAVVQHGYSHHNFATPDERKIELDGSRPAEHVIADLAVGMQALAPLPGWLPVLVPPWNRIAPHLLPLLPELGFRGLSALGARSKPHAFVGLAQNNVHIDPIDWRGRQAQPRAFAGTDAAIAAAVAHLAARRTGGADGDEATGLMTHHLVQDAATWQFVEAFIGATKDHSAVAWLAADQLFEPVR